ncbi:pleckstrin homology domain-containing family G member 3 isoform X2 [Gopherus evgoodei]|uniref:pleckstrin homology domain-containing family G member 3 isoform X2 n=1 Tax=Gopherus evgoodei TaxID=1825980 RepID=UPI0011CFC4B5|nr:pleckstrin homology domain-containing family G member 3 isoform X2 [Gopherus evgoodei]
MLGQGMFIWEEKISLPWLPGCISKLWESPRLPALPCPSSYDRMPICAVSPECPVSQMPMEGRDKAPGHAPAREGDALRVNQLHNSNNNASLGGWLGRRGSRSLSPFGPRASVGANHKLSYLERVVLELVESERTYVQDLRSIVEDYLGKIIDTEELLLQPEQVCALFGNIEDIYELNSELLQDLDSCDSNPVAVARCFVDRSQDFDIYTQYCNNYPSSVAVLTECMRNKHQAKFFRERQEQIGHALPLGSYLLKPVQRILKYHLLLQEIAKHFDLEEAGYEVVEEAIDTMTCVAWYINDMKRRHEHAVRLQEIQSLLLHWKGPDLTTFGELVLEGTFRVHRVRNERTFFLFDRTLLITKRRGDHFVCKNDIPCSSLMLIESTRDSLCFSVTHYKHSKQQYNIQAKSVEEKRVWTHHIKRLILENHHAIIPQKAKEAILEMDSSHPARYRYSPERLKKAKSCQPMDEVPPQARQGRRQSEPAKQIVKQLGEKGLKHADSAGALLETGAPLQLLGSAWQLAEGEGGAEEEEEAAMGKEEEQALGQGSLEELPVSDSSEKEAGPEEEEGPVGEEQVADFASFLLAALHGWHCRANALLFSWGRTGKGRKGSQEPGGPENRCSAETASAILEAAPEPSELHEEEHPEESPETASTPELAQPRAMELEQNLAMVENTEDLKAMSSEEDEEEEETRARSILPPSVLDHASLIAEMFASSFSRRSSLALEEGRPGGFLTPRLVSRSSSVLSLEGSEKGQGHSSAADSQGRVSPQGSTRSGTASPSPLEPERTPCPRKESMLSRQDRLLLDKIKSYYECAEHRDAGFGIRRRESLSYIPKGLVRNSVCRLNSLPPPPEQHTNTRWGVGSGSRTAAWVLAGVPTPGPRAEPSTPVGEEEFRPPAEMIKVWEGMEKSTSQPCPEEGSREGTAGAAAAWPLGRSQENGLDLHEPLLILEDDELSAIAEESANPSPESRSPTERAGPTRLASQLQRLVQELGHPAKPRPRVPPLSEAKLSEHLKNKVYQLARQYSLRIRNCQPAGHRRLAKLEELRSCAAPPPCDEHQEVKRSTGPQKPALSPMTFEQAVLQEYSPRTPRSATASSQDKSPKCFSFSPSCPASPGSGASSCSPLSPMVAETFTWPDVRELRSRYSFGTAFPGPRRPAPVNRSRSAPEKMAAELPGGVLGQEGWRGLEQSPGRGRGIESPDPSAQQRQRNQSAGSLRITAEAMLGDQRVIVLEKVPCGGDPPAPEDPPDAASYVQIRSPTSRERISLKAVAERCKAYQESDEYLRREEGWAAGWEQAAASQHGRVRNLREKFLNLNSAS